MALLTGTKATFFNWTGTALLSIITFLAANIYNDVRELKSDVPVLRQQIKSLEEDNSRLKNKVFAMTYTPVFAKKEEIIIFDELTKTFKQNR